MLTVSQWRSAVVHLFVFIKYWFLKSLRADPIKTQLGWKSWQRFSQPRANLFLQSYLKKQECWQGWVVNMSCTSCSVSLFWMPCVNRTSELSETHVTEALTGLWWWIKIRWVKLLPPLTICPTLCCASQNSNIWSVHESAFIKQNLAWNFNVIWTGPGLL